MFTLVNFIHFYFYKIYANMGIVNYSNATMYFVFSVYHLLFISMGRQMTMKLECQGDGFSTYLMKLNDLQNYCKCVVLLPLFQTYVRRAADVQYLHASKTMFTILIAQGFEIIIQGVTIVISRILILRLCKAFRCGHCINNVRQYDRISQQIDTNNQTKAQMSCCPCVLSNIYIFSSLVLYT